MAISDFVKALADTRETIASLNAKIAKLKADRDKVCATPPHADDIISAYNRGLREAVEQYERRLGHFLNDRNATKPHAAETVKHSSAQLLCVPDLMPSRGIRPEDDRSSLFMLSDFTYGGAPAHISAVVYFLRDVIAAEIPKLVAKFAPAAESGMRQADREAALAKLDNELDHLITDRDAMLATLDEVREAAMPDTKPMLQ